MADSQQKIDPVFKLLIERTRVLATVVDNAGEVLSEEFQGMVYGPLMGVLDVLNKCPDVSAWDGSFSEDDIIIDVFRHDAQQAPTPVSVRITHVPTDMSVESYSKRTAKENELVARRALSDRVRYKWEADQEAQQQAGDAPRRPRRSKSRT